MLACTFHANNHGFGRSVQEMTESFKTWFAKSFNSSFNTPKKKFQFEVTFPFKSCFEISQCWSNVSVHFLVKHTFLLLKRQNFDFCEHSFWFFCSVKTFCSNKNCLLGCRSSLRFRKYKLFIFVSTCRWRVSYTNCCHNSHFERLFGWQQFV